MPLRTTQTRPQFVELLRSSAGSRDDRVNRVLALLAEDLDLPLMFVREVIGNRRGFRYQSAEMPSEMEELTEAGPGSLGRLAAVADGLVVADVTQHPRLRDHPDTGRFGLGAFIGVPVRIGEQVVAILCGISPSPAPGLGAADLARMVTAAQYLAQTYDTAQGQGQRQGQGQQPNLPFE